MIGGASLDPLASAGQTPRPSSKTLFALLIARRDCRGRLFFDDFRARRWGFRASEKLNPPKIIFHRETGEGSQHRFF